MQILHTSDWHLGKTLEGRSRIPEQQAYLREVVELAQDVDVVLIAGDVFDVYNPPIEAEELYFETLATLAEGGRRQVVVIAGNHDSPDRIAAASPLATMHGVHILGRPPTTAVDLSTPAGRLVIAALPYPSEARLRTVLTEEVDERSLQTAYSAKVGAVLHQLAEGFRPDAVNLCLSHLQVRRCLSSESERVLVGGAYQVDTEAFPETAQYVALGHLHRAQDVPDSLVPTRYCGAPLAFRFSERELERTHTLVSIEPGGQAVVRTEPIQAGRPLVLWSVSSLAELLAEVEDGAHADAFIDLELRLDAPPTHADLTTLRRLPRDFVRIRAVLPEAQETPAGESRLQLDPADLFRAFHRDQTGSEPDQGLIELFLELVR